MKPASSMYQLPFRDLVWCQCEDKRLDVGRLCYRSWRGVGRQETGFLLSCELQMPMLWLVRAEFQRFLQTASQCLVITQTSKMNLPSLFLWGPKTGSLLGSCFSGNDFLGLSLNSLLYPRSQVIRTYVNQECSEHFNCIILQIVIPCRFDMDITGKKLKN